MGKGTSKLKPGAVKDLADNTEFSKEEIQLWYKRFMTSCPTGRLTVAGLKEIYGRIFPHGDASAFVDHVFQTFDADGDGFIDFREFICSLSINTRGSLEDKLTWAFNAYDLDNSGFVSRAEMLELTTAFLKMKVPNDGSTPEMVTDKIFKLMDKDSDGQLSLTEFIEGAKSDMSLVGTILNK